MEEVKELCDRIVIMDRGKFLADGTPAQLKALIEDRRVYEIDLWGSGERYQTLVAELPFVESCNSRNGLLEIRLTQVDALKSLVALFDAGDIRRIGVKESSLEEVYLHLTGRTIREC
jgi:ABC-2 type transport system ATP-binding protein